METNEIIKENFFYKIIIQELEAWVYAIRCIKMDLDILYKEALISIKTYTRDKRLRCGKDEKYYINIFKNMIKKEI